MYASYFGLRQAPFSIAPDPRYLFMSERHREALAHLLYGVGGGGGFVLLTGEIGAGKTTVCRCFLEQIPRRCNVAYIFNPKLTAAELLQAICDEFRIPVLPDASGQASMKAHVDALNEYLLKTHAVGQNNVLIIDEAQNLSPEVLEQLRLLTNLETSERKLLQIILIGQPELRQILAQPALEQLAQRVIARFHLDALSASETEQYIHHRLATAGLKRGTLFDGKASARIHQLTKGVPRRINLLCDRALLGAFAQSKPRVDRHIVDKAAAEVFEGQSFVAEPATTPPMVGEATPHAPRWTWPRWAWATASGGLTLGIAGLMLADWTHRQQTVASAPRTPTLAPTAAGLGESLNATLPLASPSAAMSASASGSASAQGSAGSDAPAGANPPTKAAAAAVAGVAIAADWAKAEPIDAQELTRRAATNEALALRDLATWWGSKLGSGDPCAEGRRLALLCFRASGGLDLLTQLDRPALLTLRDGQGRTRHAVLAQLDRQNAWLWVDQQAVRMPLSALASVWRGDFATFWRAPEGFRAKLTVGQSGTSVDWLAARLSDVDRGPAVPEPARLDAVLQARLQAFQMSQGLKPDGIAGATTLMLLNRAAGIQEPRLVRPESPPAKPTTLATTPAFAPTPRR
jgi:general secretion pathway protein A